MSGTKNVPGDGVKDVQKIGKSTLGKKDDKIVENENIDLEGIYARLAEASFFSIVNISEGLEEDDNEDFKILNEFLNTSDEA